jgi:hypothetical protein
MSSLEDELPKKKARGKSKVVPAFSIRHAPTSPYRLNPELRDRETSGAIETLQTILSWPL